MAVRAVESDNRICDLLSKEYFGSIFTESQELGVQSGNHLSYLGNWMGTRKKLHDFIIKLIKEDGMME